jgi:hypothetical protein
LWISFVEVKNSYFYVQEYIYTPPRFAKMKNRMLVRLGKSILGAAMLLGLVGGAASAQTVNANAMKAFQASSGGANASWVAGPNSSWEATWVKEGQKMVYCYDQAGILQQKKIVAAITTFPATINASITAAYPQGKVQGAYKVVDRSNQKFYEVQVANAASVDRMRYSLEGKPLGKTSMAAVQPAGAQPTLTASAATPAPKPAAPVATVAKPATPAAKPATPVAVAKPTTASPPMAMRGEAASTSTTKTAASTVKNDDLIDDDLGDLLEDDGDMDDLFKDDENWDDIDLDDELDDDSDLLDGTDSLDDDLDLDDDLEDEDDGF